MSVVERGPAAVAALEQLHDTPTPVKPGAGISPSELIQRARDASGEEQAWLCSLLNRALTALSTATDKDRQAALLLELLDDKALDGLEDERRVPCRAVAVEALLTIGYPWALQLVPEDVQFLREHPAKAVPRLPLARIAGAAAGLGSLTVFGLSLAQAGSWWWPELVRRPPELALAVALSLTALCAPSVALGRPWLLLARWVLGLASLVVGGVVLADAVAYSPGLGHALLLGVSVAGVLGGVLPRDPPIRRDEL